MGRAISGMEDEGPITDACTMPSFISSLEEGSVKLSRRYLPTETSFTDSKVERSVRDLSRRVTRSTSRLSLDGGERYPGERSSGGGVGYEGQQQQQLQRWRRREEESERCRDFEEEFRGVKVFLSVSEHKQSDAARRRA
ncbi:hypothetical protein OYC64_005258 [Pagothenia borchgrevinki]|uniref:Uncharacterized protein n=1 Tax=Pagothenia borchgrevinki TaxID=8213 RepID=A0ABD2GFA9_PAGBO